MNFLTFFSLYEPLLKNTTYLARVSEKFRRWESRVADDRWSQNDTAARAVFFRQFQQGKCIFKNSDDARALWRPRPAVGAAVRHFRRSLFSPWISNLENSWLRFFFFFSFWFSLPEQAERRNSSHLHFVYTQLVEWLVPRIPGVGLRCAAVVSESKRRITYGKFADLVWIIKVVIAKVRCIHTYLKSEREKERSGIYSEVLSYTLEKVGGKFYIVSFSRASFSLARFKCSDLLRNFIAKLRSFVVCCPRVVNTRNEIRGSGWLFLPVGWGFYGCCKYSVYVYDNVRE